MKLVFALGSLFMTTLILILAFENIAGMCTYLYFLFIPMPTNLAPTFLIFGVSFMGIITGMLYSAFFRSLFSGRGSEGEEDEDF